MKVAKHSIPARADPARRPDGRFVPGHTRGRPKGRCNSRTIIEERLAISAQTREDLNAYHGVPAEMVRADPLCQFGFRTRPSTRRLTTASCLR